jgi:CRP/FNR family cyclic AMP-dependent transcriptional regulator
VEALPLLKFDPQNFLSKIGTGKTITVFKKNQIVFEQGDHADSIFYIQKGRIKLSVRSHQGKDAVVGIMGAGQFFGEACLNGQKLRISTNVAMETCVVTAITKAVMIATLHKELSFSKLFVAHLLTRNRRAEADLIDQHFNSIERRLARRLLLLANFGKDGPSQAINPNVSQGMLAEMIGTTRSRVSFFMNKFRKLGLITYNGHIEVNTSLLNAMLYDQPHEQERQGGGLRRTINGNRRPRLATARSE